MIVEKLIFDACIGGATVTMRIDDATGELLELAWNVQAGVLTLPVPGGPTVIAIAGDEGRMTVPSRLPLERHPKDGSWIFADADGRSISWGDAPHLGAGRWREVDPDVRREQATALRLSMMEAKS